MPYRWFTDPAERGIHPRADHPYHSRVYTAGLRARLTTHGDDSRARELIDALGRDSDEFAELWSRHEVAERTSDRKRMVHPAIGTIELDCQTLIAENQAQILLVYTATPGSEDYDRLQLLSVIGAQHFNTAELDDSQLAPPPSATTER